MKIATRDEVSEDGLSLTTRRPVANYNPGTASMDKRRRRRTMRIKKAVIKVYKLGYIQCKKQRGRFCSIKLLLLLHKCRQIKTLMNSDIIYLW